MRVDRIQANLRKLLARENPSDLFAKVMFLRLEKGDADYSLANRTSFAA